MTLCWSIAVGWLYFYIFVMLAVPQSWAVSVTSHARSPPVEISKQLKLIDRRLTAMKVYHEITCSVAIVIVNLCDRMLKTLNFVRKFSSCQERAVSKSKGFWSVLNQYKPFFHQKPFVKTSLQTSNCFFNNISGLKQF